MTFQGHMTTQKALLTGGAHGVDGCPNQKRQLPGCLVEIVPSLQLGCRLCAARSRSHSTTIHVAVRFAPRRVPADRT
jgi:hypothetical protein